MIFKKLSPSLATTSPLFYNLPEIVTPLQDHASCTWHARGYAKGITERRREKCRQFEKNMTSNSSLSAMPIVMWLAWWTVPCCIFDV